jgi:hypothetical protein
MGLLEIIEQQGADLSGHQDPDGEATFWPASTSLPTSLQSLVVPGFQCVDQLLELKQLTHIVSR